MKALAFAAVVLVGGVAHADPEPFRDRFRLESAFGLRLGSVHIGPFDAFAVGFHIDGGVRRDRWLLNVEYMLLSAREQPVVPLTDPAPMPLLSAIVQRAGFDARYSIGRLAGGDRQNLRGDFWLEAGAGVEVVRWDQGGALHRPDVSLGFGGQFSARFGDRLEHRLGMYYAFKATLAHGEGSTDRKPTCAGPCDTATPPFDFDRTFLFNLGVLFGN